MKARFIEINRIASDTGAFTVEPQEPFTFQPGQTCDITLTSPRYEDEKGSIRTFSIASSPADLPRLTFATRLTGSAFKRSLLEAPAGTELEVDGPYGSFTLHRNAAKPAVCFAGGIGITPFRAIVKDAAERALPHSITLFYSNRSAGGTAFLAELEAWQRQNSHFRLVPTITAPVDGESWAHHVGLIDAAFVKRHLPDGEAIYYIAGPPAFVTGMRQALDTLGADPDNIRTEEFPGY